MTRVFSEILFINSIKNIIKKLDATYYITYKNQ